MWIMKIKILFLLISSQKLYFGDDDAIYDIIIQEPVWNLLNQYSFGNTQPFSFLGKSTGPILPFVVLAL